MKGVQIERSENDLIQTRSELRDLLLNSRFCKVHIVKHSDNPLKCKYAFTVQDQLAEEVRVYVRQLRRLREFLEDVGQMVADRHRLWLPAVADAGEGDRQLKLTAHDNWVSNNTTVEGIYEDLIPSANGEGIGSLIDRETEGISELRKCRESGKSYRVAILDKDWSRRAQGLNEFCIAIGGVRFIQDGERTRSPRRDAWRGQDNALFSYVGVGGYTWQVYKR